MRIVIGVDGSRAAEVACEFVAGRPWPLGTRVKLLGVVEPVANWTGLAAGSWEGLDAESEAVAIVLDGAADRMRCAGLAVDTMVGVGQSASLLMAEAAKDFADLIVVGNRGRGPAASAVLGSVSAQLVDHAACPVLVVRSPSATRMLLATDGTASSRSIPRILAAWGNAFRGLPTEVLSVARHDAFVTPWASEEHMGNGEVSLHEGIAEEVADELLELGWHAAAIARVGDPGRAIVDAGREWKADLIVTGSRGIGTLHRLMTGSVAHDVLLHAGSSVLVVRGQVPARRHAAATASLVGAC